MYRAYHRWQAAGAGSRRSCASFSTSVFEEPIEDAKTIRRRRVMQRWAALGCFVAIGSGVATYITSEMLSSSLSKYDAAANLDKEEQLMRLVAICKLCASERAWNKAIESPARAILSSAASSQDAEIKTIALRSLANLGSHGDVGQRQVASMCDTKAILIDLATNYEQYKTKSYAFSAGKINIGTICLADAMLDFALVMASYKNFREQMATEQFTHFLATRLSDTSEGTSTRGSVIRIASEVTKSAPGRIALAKTTLFQTLYDMVYRGKGEQATIAWGAEWSEKNRRAAKFTMQQLLLSQSAVGELLRLHNEYVLGLDSVGKNELLRTFDAEKEELSQRLASIARDFFVAAAFAVPYGMARARLSVFWQGSAGGKLALRDGVRASVGAIGLLSMFDLVKFATANYTSRYGSNEYFPLFIGGSSLLLVGTIYVCATMLPYCLVPALVGKTGGATKEFALRHLSSVRKPQPETSDV